MADPAGAAAAPSSAKRIALTFPDGARREYPANTTGLDIAKGISPSLAKRTVAMALDGVLADLSDPIEQDAKIEFVSREDPRVPSVTFMWKGAEWMEREVYDMFGIEFHGHLDLRRILMPEEFTAFPLRKDYPLKGYGERHNFPVLTRAES